VLYCSYEAKKLHFITIRITYTHRIVCRYDAVVQAYWDRQGPYLYPKVGRDSYGEFASRCLALGIVISPDYDIPSVVPWGASGLPNI
jgi:hypothetical protein